MILVLIFNAFETVLQTYFPDIYAEEFQCDQDLCQNSLTVFFIIQGTRSNC